MKQILFPEAYCAALVDLEPFNPTGDGEVLVKTEYIAVSAGTERANYIGEENISGVRTPEPLGFPRYVGYCGVGIVQETGKTVTTVKPGDRVIILFGLNREYNLMPEEKVIKVDDGVDPLDVVLTVIATFPMLAVRRTRLEIGESCLVAGLGILGLLAVQLASAAGGCPVIAVDFSEERRSLALKCGADYAFDPSDPDFIEKVKAVTDGKGADTVIEVTGSTQALSQLLEVTARFGRIGLLGCTRHPVDGLDFYHMVHYPGIELIGVHTHARADVESRPNCWTARDDCKALLKLAKTGKINMRMLVSEIHSPHEAPQVYDRLGKDPKNFPIGVIFDWNQL